jgi:hypothetical protein
VIQIYEPESVNTIPFFGCGGALVGTRFVGRSRATVIVSADDSTDFELEPREDPSSHRHGVDYTADGTFNPPAQGG